MSFFHVDSRGYKKDKYDNFASKEEVTRAVNNGDLKEFSNGKFVYDPKTREEYWRDGKKR